MKKMKDIRKWDYQMNEMTERFKNVENFSFPFFDCVVSFRLFLKTEKSGEMTISDLDHSIILISFNN
jgi:hypothetical protein